MVRSRTKEEPRAATSLNHILLMKCALELVQIAILLLFFFIMGSVISFGTTEFKVPVPYERFFRYHLFIFFGFFETKTVKLIRILAHMVGKSAWCY